LLTFYNSIERQGFFVDNHIYIKSLSYSIFRFFRKWSNNGRHTMETILVVFWLRKERLIIVLNY